MCPTLNCKAYLHAQSQRAAKYVQTDNLRYTAYYNTKGFQIPNISKFYVQTPHLHICYVFFAE